MVVPMLALVGARLVAWDSRSLLIGLDALLPLLLLPAWPVAVAAGVTGRRALCAAATVVVVAHGAFVAPELLAREPAPAVPVDALRFRLFTANVYAGNARPDGIAGEIRDSRPDIVFLQEATPAFVEAVDRTGALGDLPHRVTVARTDPFAGLLASRWPLVDDDVVEVDGRPIVIRATAMTDRGPLRLYSVHVVAPVGGGRQAWASELGRVAAAVRGERQPVLVAGDFNATWAHRAFRRLLHAGLTDGAAARGRPLQATWPRDRRLVPPLLRIDHVLTTPGLAVRHLRTGHGQGSDHRPLVADVAGTA
jgi:endonuclease/exonuclease/phosphatase (EEP) superfamily protein YafD